MLALLIILALVAVVIEATDSRPIEQAAVVAGIAATLAYVWSRLSVRRLTLIREPLVDHVAVGDRFEEQLTLVNGAWLLKPWLEVFDFSTLPGHGAGQVVRVRGRGSVRWRAHSSCTRRGEFELGPIRVRSGDPFGLFARTVVAPDTIKVLVWPYSTSMPEFHEPGGVFSGGPRQGWSPYVAPSISGIREYAPGDPFNRIAWRATARTGALMVKELEQDPISDIWLVLDLRRSTHVEAIGAYQLLAPHATERLLASTTEYGISLAASLARTYLERGRSVGVILAGFHPVILSPDRGDAHIGRIMDYLAVAQPDGATPLDVTIRAHDERFNRQASLIAISSETEDAWAEELSRLSGLGVPAQAVVVQPESFGGEATSLPVIGALIAGNVPVTTVAFGDRIAGVTNDAAPVGGFHAAR